MQAQKTAVPIPYKALNIVLYPSSLGFLALCVLKQSAIYRIIAAAPALSFSGGGRSKPQSLRSLVYYCDRDALDPGTATAAGAAWYIQTSPPAFQYKDTSGIAIFWFLACGQFKAYY